VHGLILPSSALFAFNSNIDHLRAATDEDIAKIERFSPALSSQIEECFAYGVQKEITIDIKACDFLLSSLKFDQKMVGGQAGNAALQASALGVSCFLHSNFANEELLNLFPNKESIMVAGENGFVPAGNYKSNAKSAHHFVFEHPETRTRFIASYDPVPLHLDDNFARAIDSALPQIQKALVSGFHLVKTVPRLHKLLDEVCRWKALNPALKTFLELGEFQSAEVRDALRSELKLFDMVGLNDTELSSFGCELDELALDANSLLFHTPEHSLILPREKENSVALSFAEKCASFLAKNARHAALSELEAHETEFVENPARTVGLGDTLSCAYFMMD
jgi:ADP-dependent phosphofructokinase/glucokinase